MKTLVEQLICWKFERPDEWRMLEFINLAKEQAAEIAKLREAVAMETINLLKGTIAHLQQEKGWALDDALSHACDDIFYGAKVRLEALEATK